MLLRPSRDQFSTLAQKSFSWDGFINSHLSVQSPRDRCFDHLHVGNDRTKKLPGLAYPTHLTNPGLFRNISSNISILNVLGQNVGIRSNLHGILKTKFLVLLTSWPPKNVPFLKNCVYSFKRMKKSKLNKTSTAAKFSRQIDAKILAWPEEDSLIVQDWCPSVEAPSKIAGLSEMSSSQLMSIVNYDFPSFGWGGKCQRIL